MDYSIFVLLSLAAVLSPGPAVLLTVSNSARFGVNAAFYGIAGNVSAMLCMAALSAAGLGALLQASELGFTLLKIVGGAYLIYLGIKAWRQSRQAQWSLELQSEKMDAITEEGRTQRQGVAKAKHLFAEAFLVGISNPKAIVFYSALFPQFLHLDQPIAAQFVLLAGTFACCSCSALIGYAWLAGQLKELLKRPKISQRFHQITGGIFIGFGCSLLAASR